MYASQEQSDYGKQFATSPRLRSAPAANIAALDNVIQAEMNVTCDRSYTLSPSRNIGSMGGPHELAEVKTLLIKDVTANESCAEPKDSSFTSIATAKWLPIAEKCRDSRSRLLSSCSTTCTRSDGGNASPMGSDSHCASYVFPNTSWGNGSLRKTSWADMTDECFLEENSYRNQIESRAEARPAFLVPENEPNAEQTSVEPDYTTVMVCELPCRVTQTVFSAALDALGFGDDYDYLYVPTRRGSGLGYGFVNFLTHSHARAFSNAFQNYQFGGTQSKKVCTVKPARLQGLQENLEQFTRPQRNRGVKKSSLPVINVKGPDIEQA